MPKKAKELKDAEVRKLGHGFIQGDDHPRKGEPCAAYHAVGGVSGLLVCVKPSGSRSWILRTMVGGERRDIGLGGYPELPLSVARDKARGDSRKQPKRPRADTCVNKGTSRGEGSGEGVLTLNYCRIS